MKRISVSLLALATLAGIVASCPTHLDNPMPDASSIYRSENPRRIPRPGK